MPEPVPPPFNLAQTGGFVTSATSTTLTDSNQNWTSSLYVGSWVVILQGTGSIQAPLLITANTATQLTVTGWAVQPDTTSQYCIFPFQPVLGNNGGPGSISNGLTPGATIQGPPYTILTTDSYSVYKGSDGNFYALASPESGFLNIGPSSAPDTSIQSAFNNLKGVNGLGGGSVRIGGQVYGQTLSSINVFPGMRLVGIGLLGADTTAQGTCKIVAPSSLNAPIVDLQLDPNNPNLYSFANIGDLCIVGAGTGSNTLQDGVKADNVNGTFQDSFIERMGVFGVGGNCFNLSNGGKHWLHDIYGESAKGAGVSQTISSFTRISRGYFFGNATGINFTLNSVQTAQASENLVNANTGQGLIYGGGSGAASVRGNTFVNNGSNTTEAVTIFAQTSVNGGLLFSDNIIQDTRTSGSRAKYAINIAPSPPGPVMASILNNLILGSYLTSVYHDTGWHSTVILRNNQGLNPFGVLATPFGGVITNPFSATRVGYGGSSSTPTTTVTYTVNAPIDVTIAAGTGQTITTKDGLGNIIDNAVATLSHRLLREWYTITVTASAVGATTVYQASVGLGGTTATMAANVNYVICGCDCYVAGGTVLTSLTINDGTTNTGGNSIFTPGTAFPADGVLLPVGWNFSSTAVTTNPTVVGN